MRLMSMVSAVAIAAAAFSSAPDAFAQRNRGQAAASVVVNYQRIAAESALGRDMAAKLQQVRTQIGTEAQALQPEAQSLEQEAQRLQNATRNMTPEQIRNHATWGPQFQQFGQRRQQHQARAAALQGDLECSQLISLRDFDRVVSPIIRSVMQQRGAGMVIDAGNVNYVAPEYDITNTVIQQLDQNQATRTANVTRHAVAECQAQQQQPAATTGQ
ncbi:MAG: OmpH family outer membrane protein [Hyphomonadaceae bacterium]|mgnify:CR=1 FL=1|nr:OmpH family outer membrane protein [Hyphomonadaceae bacterium]